MEETLLFQGSQSERDSFSDNTAKSVVFTEILNTFVDPLFKHRYPVVCVCGRGGGVGKTPV